MLRYGMMLSMSKTHPLGVIIGSCGRPGDGKLPSGEAVGVAGVPRGGWRMAGEKHGGLVVELRS